MFQKVGGFYVNLVVEGGGVSSLSSMLVHATGVGQRRKILNVQLLSFNISSLLQVRGILF